MKKVLMFTGESCTKCKNLYPIIEELGDKYTFEVVSVDDNPALGAKYRVRGLPTLVALDDNAVLSTIVGAMTKGQLLNWLEEAGV